jgi:hypothetical protein
LHLQSTLNKLSEINNTGHYPPHFYTNTETAKLALPSHLLYFTLLVISIFASLILSSFLESLKLPPAARAVFHFAPNEDVRANANFLQHARVFVDMMDCAVGFLGPDLDPFAEDLHALGLRHANYGVPIDSLVVVGIVFFDALKQFLGDWFNARSQASFQAVFRFMVANMKIGYSLKVK